MFHVLLLFLPLLFQNLISCNGQYVVSDQFTVGRTFQGIGAISGGGPNFGASLQILKVEIGGDDETSGGTEASHMHEEWDENYNRGYEWWVMKEAKKRNPNIKLWGLSWTWPHWLGDSNHQPYKAVNKTALYTVNWIKGAKEYHNLTIDYIGIWNEQECNFNYILALRNALNENEMTKNTQIVACDNFQDFYTIYRNKTVVNSIYAYGAHYPGTKMPSIAILSNITLWASEDYSTYNNDIGAGCWARILNQNYVNGYMTSQFTDIGWKYLDHGFGVGHLEGGGSFVTLMSPDAKQLTLIIETMSHDHSVCIRPDLPPYNVSEQQVATFKFGGKFKKLKNLWLWRTDLHFDGTPSVPFKSYGLIPVINSTLTVTLEVDNVYTFTTINEGNHGDFGDQSVSAPFPLPYEDDFQSYEDSMEPYLLTPQVGSWEIVRDENGSQFCRQSVLAQPVPWCGSNIYPFAVIGDTNWTEVNITATLRIPSVNGTDSVFVAGLINFQGCSLNQTKGVFFWLKKHSSTFSLTFDIGSQTVIIERDVGFAVQFDTWYTLRLNVMKNNTISGSVDGVSKFTYTGVVSVGKGWAGIGSVSYGHSDIKYLLLDKNTDKNTM